MILIFVGQNFIKSDADDNKRRFIILKRRTELDLIQVILSFAEEDNIGRTKLLARSGMSYNQFNSYVTSLIEKEFLEETVEEGHKFYLTTEKGSYLLADLNKIIKKIR